MQVTNLEVWEAKESLQQLLKEPLPIRTAYALAKLGKQIVEQHALVEQLRVKLIMQYGQPDGQGQMVVPPESAHWPQFAQEYSVLMGEKVEIAGEKIKLPAADDLRLPPAVLMALEAFVEVV